ncbi:hypothetical protein LTR02_017652 [Friedmanniomyces endolithicus]|nr:hypothetical protein LTR02_017652 [Friedmanniomyces endolithicus]
MWTPLHSSGPIFPNAPAESDSHTNHTPPSLATPATHRKLGTGHVSTPGDGDSPTKRLRFDEPTEKQLGTHGSDEGSFVPLADSDSSQSSRFDYRGDFAFSSVRGDSHGEANAVQS